LHNQDILAANQEWKDKPEGKRKGVT